MGKNALWKEIENAKWSSRIEILCIGLNIPLLTSRKDLRKVHRNFPEIYLKLKKCYNDNNTRVLVQGTVVAIYARMCVDSLLRNKLAAEKTFIPQIFRLLYSSVCRAVALQCLATLTYYGNREFRYRMAGYIPELLRLAQENIDDPSVSNACAPIISHPISTILCPGEPHVPVNQQALESVGPLLPVFVFFTALIRNPNTTYEAYKHVLHCLFDITKNARDTYLSYQPSITVMIAAFRSISLEIRVYALKGLMCLHIPVAERDEPPWDAQTILHNARSLKQVCQFSSETTDALQAYGMSRSDIALIVECFDGSIEAMIQFAATHDYYSLGMKLFELIGKTEFSISDSSLQVMGPDLKPTKVEMPFTYWVDALPPCAKAIREKGGPSRDYIANVLDLKFFILRERYKEARELAANALKASSKITFYCYILALAAEKIEEVLRWAKKGLQNHETGVEPYIRRHLLFISSQSAIFLGFEYLARSQKCQKEFEEAYALFKVALEDAKAFVAEAPPDNRLMPDAIHLCILLTIALKGPDLSQDLREIQPLFKQLRIAEEIERLLTGRAPPNSQLRLALPDIVKHYKSAAEEWGSIISRFDAQADPPITSKEPVSARSPEDELADWLNSTSLEDGKNAYRCVHHEHIHPSRSIFGSEVWMYVCAHCGSASVALKKCTRCLKTKYCDASCQKLHWPEHKKKCKPPAAP